MEVLDMSEINSAVRRYNEDFSVLHSPHDFNCMEWCLLAERASIYPIYYKGYDSRKRPVAWLMFNIAGNKFFLKGNVWSSEPAKEELPDIAEVIEEEIAKPAGMDLLYIH
jgi:hypothetical protein